MGQHHFRCQVVLSVCCPSFTGSTPLIFCSSLNPGRDRGSELTWPMIRGEISNTSQNIFRYRLIYQQRKEIRRFLPSAKVQIIQGNRGPGPGTRCTVWYGGVNSYRGCISLSLYQIERKEIECRSLSWYLKIVNVVNLLAKGVEK